MIRINIICPTKPIARKMTLSSHSKVNVVVFVGTSFFLNTFKQKSKFFPSTYLHVSVDALNPPPREGLRSLDWVRSQIMAEATPLTSSGLPIYGPRQFDSLPQEIRYS